jgi:hypothetical protein
LTRALGVARREETTHNGSVKQKEESVGLFKKKPDTMSLTMAYVQAAADEDPTAMLQAATALGSVSPADIFANLGDFYQRIAPSVTPEHKAVMRAEIAATAGPPEVVTAVQAIAIPLIVEPNGHAAAAAINLYGGKLVDNKDNLWSGVIMETLDAAGRINRRIGVTLNWA